MSTLKDPGEPAQCIRCKGAGTIETCTFGIGLHDVRCPGVDDDYSCDGGFIRAADTALADDAGPRTLGSLAAGQPLRVNLSATVR